MKIFKVDYESPIGVIEIMGTDKAILAVDFSEAEKPVNLLDAATPTVLTECYNQLDEYFKGNRQEFTLSYQSEGTNFQQSVWNALKEIPYGETRSYKDIAVSIENDKAVRAVGNANNKNKLGIVIPCHRVIGTNRSLTGYAGGLWRKEWLLKHEETNVEK